MLPKITVITGASSGIGESVCSEFINKGYKVYGISRTQPKLTSKLFKWIKTDLYKPNEIKNIKSKIKEDNISFLINCAGTAKEKLAIEYSEKDFDLTFDLNFKAPIYLTQSFKTKLQGGTIINISSTSDRIPEKMYSLYCASKTALNLFFDSLSLEEKNIKIINILPDYVDTPLLRKVIGRDKNFDWSIPLKSQQIAKAIIQIITRQEVISGSQIIIASNKLKSSFNNHEKLWGFNVDTKKLSNLN